MSRTGCRAGLIRYNVALSDVASTDGVNGRAWRGRVSAGPRASDVYQVSLKGRSMEKWLCWGSLGVSGVLLILFLLDLIIKIPFGGLSLAVDIVALLAAGLVIYLSWEALREVR